MNKKNSSGPPDVAGKPPLAFFEFSAAVARLTRRFRVDVSTIVSAVALTQSLLLATLGYWGSQRLVAKIGASAHAANHHRTEDNVLAVLAKAESAVGALAGAPSLGPAGEHAQRTAELLWTLLQQSPELDSLYVADETGQMLMALRYPVPAIRRIARSASAGAGEPATETWQYKLPPAPEVDAQQRFATQRIESFRSSYDPRLQRWYQEARQMHRPVWTAPYTFAATQELGVSYALPGKRRAAEGSPRLLVVGGDVSLGRLSEFVRLFASGGRGDGALLNTGGQVLARSDQPGVLRQPEPPTGVLGALHAHLLANGTPDGEGGAAFSFDHEGRSYLAQASRIPSAGWQLVSWVPQDFVLGELRRAVLWWLLLGLALLAAALFVSLQLSRLVTSPVEKLSQIARRIGLLELDDLPREPSRVLEIQHLDQALDESARSLRAFSKFVPVDVIHQLVADGQALAPSGSPRRVTVMFTDIEGFTRISESMEANVLVRMLTEYFNLATGVLARYGGVIDKFMGDGIMVLWGAPADLKDAEYRACLAALQLHIETSALNRKWRADGLPEFRTRIGIHTGVVIAGVLGSNDRLSYTALGDVVNVASRIEGINKQLGTQTLISEVTFAGLKGRLQTRRIDERVALRGRQTRMVLYELLMP
ncbi:adenylate/guanylate cyclase domain-containing protein [Variovorax paradoxus]|uniref:adenylate/guanylate cyclase domain-containing protein n=1 Tax=Variovorax paradoxus TaxID=34073 RepID=UPI00278B5592|nr:adenylate/guanylate cyclase domain-containing protein [Variovorax paradoxus]MDQ0588549.1 adenylate cyclase [Variovorax paradoxus]